MIDPNTIERGPSSGPITILVYGADKIGKSTLAQAAPDNIFIDVNKGTAELDAARFPVPEKWTWDYFWDCLEFALKGQHSFKTLTIDTSNDLEPCVFEKYVRDHPTFLDGKITKTASGIDDYPFSSGRKGAVDVWREIFRHLELIRRDRGMNIIILAHAQTRMFENPKGPNYEQWAPAGDKHGVGALCQWVGGVLYAAEHVAVSKESKWDKAKGQSAGERKLYCIGEPAFHAGNRYGLPREIPLSWDELWSYARGAKRQTPDIAWARICSMTGLTDELAQKIQRAQSKFPTDLTKILHFESYLIGEINNAKPTD